MILLDNFYELKDLKFEDNKISGVLKINQSHHIFDGHFPEIPVVPGVCMMEMIKEVLQVAQNEKFRLVEGGNIKFMNILNPNECPEVNIEEEIVAQENDRITIKSTIFTSDKIFLKFLGTFSLLQD